MMKKGFDIFKGSGAQLIWLWIFWTIFLQV